MCSLLICVGVLCVCVIQRVRLAVWGVQVSEVINSLLCFRLEQLSAVHFGLTNVTPHSRNLGQRKQQSPFNAHDRTQANPVLSRSILNRLFIFILVDKSLLISSPMQPHVHTPKNK